MLRKVLLAYGDSAGAEEALSLAIELVRCLQADMHIVVAVKPAQNPEAPDVGADRRYAWQRLRSAEGHTSRAGLVVQLNVVEGDPAAQIIEHARRIAADIIVLGHAHHGRLEPMSGGSVAARVLEQAPCAVLMPSVRP